jgi:hypothetical protein
MSLVTAQQAFVASSRLTTNFDHFLFIGFALGSVVDSLVLLGQPHAQFNSNGRLSLPKTDPVIRLIGFTGEGSV